MIEKFSLKVPTPYLPKAIVQGALDKRKIKEKGVGNLHPDEDEATTPGYAPHRPKEELDPEREIIEHVDYTRNNTRQSKLE